MKTRTIYIHKALTKLQLRGVVGTVATADVQHNTSCEIPCLTFPVRTHAGRTIQKVRELLKSWKINIVSEE